MKFKVSASTLAGEISVPPSKSHTLRALVFASLAKGTSVIQNPLVSEDTLACLSAVELLGATVERGAAWKVTGFGGRPTVPKKAIDVKNSGTTMSFLTSVAALAGEEIRLTGDASIKGRPMEPLLSALRDLGVVAKSDGDNGCPPLTVKGPVKGGVARVDGLSSQYVSSLLICAPLFKADSDIRVRNLHEKPYVEMTMSWLKKMGVEYKSIGLRQFIIPGRQVYYDFVTTIPGDYSTATFPLVGALTTAGSEITIKGLDPVDTQGDRKIFDMVQEMGALVEKSNQGFKVKSSKLEGFEIDLNNTPDALPALAVLGCFAEGETILTHVAQARIKETDRIKVMCEELKKMGADIEEQKDGLAVRKSPLTGAEVDSHGDHRVAMALTLAGMMAEGETTVLNAEAVAVTFPDFAKRMQALGAKIEVV